MIDSGQSSPTLRNPFADGSAPAFPAGQRLAALARPTLSGRVERIGHAEADVVGIPVGIGDLVSVGEEAVLAEVVAVDGNRSTVLPYGHLRGVKAGDPVKLRGGQHQVPIGRELLGRVIDGLGRPIDDGPSLDGLLTVPIHNQAPAALSRPPVREPLVVGIRAIDTLLTCGRGQRVAILAGSGVGKSSLLSMLVRGSDADVNVLCLVGERGREVREFLDNDLGPDGLAHSVVVVATSDEPALVRRTAADVATRIAESFRDGGLKVNLLMDSVTRYAAAQREIGLAAGEIPTARGYPPSALSILPGLLERAGTSSAGSITGFYTVLVEGDDVNDPIGDTVRSIVDGHIVLSRDLANAGHFPSIDILSSASRVSGAVTTQEQQAIATEARRMIATYDRGRDLVEVGAYTHGADPQLDRAIELAPMLDAFRRQGLHESASFEQAWATLQGMLSSPFGGGAGGEGNQSAARRPGQPPNAGEQSPLAQAFGALS